MKSSSDSERKINLKAAAKYLGVSHRKMGQLLKEGALEYTVDPLDHRQKLVSMKAVELLVVSQKRCCRRFECSTYNLMTASCISSLFEKQIVRRCNRLMCVRKFRLCLSMLRVPSLPMTWFFSGSNFK
jgi:hypothetical protein